MKRARSRREVGACTHSCADLCPIHVNPRASMKQLPGTRSGADETLIIGEQPAPIHVWSSNAARGCEWLNVCGVAYEMV